MLVVCLVVGVVNADPNMTKGPYLIYNGNNTEMVVLWQLDANLPCKLEWGTTTSYGNDVNTAEISSDHRHRHTITGLNTATKYYYKVWESTDYTGPNHPGSFRTAPAPDAKNVKFLAYGDTRTYPDDHNTVCAGMVTTYTDDPDFQTMLLHCGDWVGWDSNYPPDQWGMFFSRSHSGIMELQANLPIQGCRGNHEFLPYGCPPVNYKKFYPYPYPDDPLPSCPPDDDGGYYWSFDYGPAHIAVVDQYCNDGNYAPGTDQYEWLVDDLNDSEAPWKFLLFHEPGWSAKPANTADVQNYIQPLCEYYGVDMVLNGHHHIYSHCDVNGIKHIVTGGGGAELHWVNLSRENVVAGKAAYHFCEIDIQGDVLYFTAREPDGLIIDKFALGMPDSPKFRINDTSGDPVAWFDGSGNLVLKGTLDANTTPEANNTIDEFRFQDPNGNDLAIIDANSGNMYITGLLYENQDTLQLDGDNHFIIKGSNDTVVAYIDDPNGSLYLKGKLYENSNP